MKNKLLLLTLAAVSSLTSHAATAPAEVFTQQMTYIKTQVGKSDDWLQIVRDTSMKIAQKRADAGELISWTLLRSVYPAGEDARADYIISEISAGSPHSALRTLDENLKQAGIGMTADELLKKRNATSALVAQELWQPQIYNGGAKKGNFLVINFMNVLDPAKHEALETTIWSPLTKEWIKQGELTGWIYATKIMPSGSESRYGAYTADMFTSMQTALASHDYDAAFAKVHPGKKVEEIFADGDKARVIAKRELWEVIERITKKP